MEVEPGLIVGIVELCRKEEKAFGGEIGLVLAGFNRLGQEKSVGQGLKKPGGKKMDGAKFLISRLDY